MYIGAQQVLAMTEAGLRDFLSLKIPEGLYLDYKQDLSGASGKEAKREFLKDITAFANAAGGHLLLGVKEPSEELSVGDQLIGLDNGEAVAQDLERLASTSVDPRIPGLRIVRVPLANERSCLVVHIPPSLGRPHMVQYGGHRSFYIRHSESSFPMSTHEIRESVLTSSSAEVRARTFVERRLNQVRTLIEDQHAAFLIQAMPLISPEAPWDVLSKRFEDVLRGHARRGKYHYYADLASNIAPRPTIDGLLGQDQNDEPNWETEVHRTGYISALYLDVQTHNVGEVPHFVVHSGTCDLFRAFCHLLKELLDAAGTDVPYLISCAYLNARGTCLWTESGWRKFSAPYQKAEIVWPEHLRGTGTDPLEVGERLSVELFNAFGLRQIVK